MTKLQDSYDWPQIYAGPTTATVWLEHGVGIAVHEGEWELIKESGHRARGLFLHVFGEKPVPWRDGLAVIPVDAPDPNGVVPDWFNKELRRHHDQNH